MKFVFLCYDSYSLPLAYHLQQEGREVLVGIVKNRSQLKLPEEHRPEKAEDREQRLANHDGLLKKRSASEVLAMLEMVKPEDRDSYVFFFDFNDMYNISQRLLDMGFRKGLFPTEMYYNLEKERERAKAFVKKFYPSLRVPETHSFKTAQDGIKFIEDSEDTFVLKSNGNVGKTVVPCTDELELARGMIRDALTENAKDYEAGGFSLEQKVRGALEVTPILVFWEGKPLYSLVEFENKALGAGNIGPLKGGNQCLSVRTEFDSKINEIAFPKAVYDLAKKQPGLAVWDAGLLFDGKDFWFTEFCAARMGWDGALCEIGMRDDGNPFVGPWFDDVAAGRNPCIKKYGVSVRLFNIESGYEDTKRARDDVPILFFGSVSDNLFLYNVRLREKDQQIVSVGGVDYLGAMTGASDDLETAVDLAYARIDKVCYESKFYRNRADFLDRSYPTSILNRLDALKSFL